MAFEGEEESFASLIRRIPGAGESPIVEGLTPYMLALIWLSDPQLLRYARNTSIALPPFPTCDILNIYFILHSTP